MRRFLSLLVVVVVLLAAIVGWFALNVYQLADAVRSRDEQGFAARADLPSIRASLARQVVDQASAGKIKGFSVTLDPAGQAIAANLIAAQLESAITPQMVFALLRSGALRDGDGSGGGAGAGGGNDGDGASTFTLPADPLSRLKGFGVALPATIRLTLGEDADPADWLTLAFSLRGLTWTLTDVILPDKAFRQLGRALRQEMRGG